MPTSARMPLQIDLVWRAVVPLAALVCLLLGTPHEWSGTLALLGLALAVDRLVSLRRLGLADRLVTGVGGALVTLVLTGPVLDAAGLRLRPTVWAAALICLSATGLVLTLVLPARVPTGPTDGPSHSTDSRRTAVRALPWVGAAVVVTVVAVRMSATSLSAADDPPLEMSFGDISGTSVQVVVSSSDAIGPLELRTSSSGTEISYPLISLPRDGSTTTTVAVPAEGRFVISLNYPDQTEPLRTLVLDR